MTGIRVPQLEIDVKKSPVASHRPQEWLVTNGLGGYASSTLHNLMTRRHHGWFVPNLRHGRTVMIPRLDEVIQTSSEQVLFNAVAFKDGRMIGDAQRCLERFYLDGSLPVWHYRIGDSLLEKRLVMPHGQNAVCLRYHLLEGENVNLKLRMYVDYRRPADTFSHPEDLPFGIEQKEGFIAVRAHQNAEVLHVRMQAPSGAEVAFTEDRLVSDGVHYREEECRGYDDHEGILSIGCYEFEITTDDVAYLVAATEPSLTVVAGAPEEYFRKERQRQQALLERVHESDPLNDFSSQLVLAADQFIVCPLPGRSLSNPETVSSVGDMVSIIAGYHWFTDWGRDTMISLEGLVLRTGRGEEARRILKTFSHHVHEGLLPNLFPEGHREALYHTVDATLWFFHAIDRYVSLTGDVSLVEELFPLLEGIVDKHVKGTLFGIHVDSDGLLAEGQEGYQLTWMDAKVGNWVVTPRRGKPVEIQALWFNALSLMAEWSGQLNRPSVYQDRADRCRRSFNRRFWYEKGGYLYDVIDSPESGDDPALRPNQIFSIALKYPVLDEDRWRKVMEVVEKELWTPYGLRTLNAGHGDYKAQYKGDLWSRDAAYHQGTVWAWLIGPFIKSWMKVHNRPEQALGMLECFEPHLKEAGVGSISEIFDADEPYCPRACIAQAWSVAEVLRCYLDLHNMVTTSAVLARDVPS